ncbi:MAG: ABC transporter permease [Spirochaetaceae bacterium]|nr:ABC transporter permease [Myxococcales bacterium]MCB9723453.1 ABC transporter permease [Spirochaetaceae bacterium]HPG26810.1 ABC transporter permease [Myxococcota bacterium]
MSSIRRIHALAVNTVREAIRNKLLYALLGFGILMIASGVLLASLSYVEVDEILQDVGLGAIRFFGSGIAIFVGIGLIHNEVDRRTIFTILSKPVSRAEFLVGKWAGLTITVWLQLLLMGVAFVVVSMGAEATLRPEHALAIAMIGLELMVLVAIATFFSAFTTPMLAGLFSVGLWLIGHLSRDFYALGQQAEDESVSRAASALFRVMPDLEVFNKTLEAVHGLPIPLAEVGMAGMYALGYTVSTLMLGAMIFARRDFK